MKRKRKKIRNFREKGKEKRSEILDRLVGLVMEMHIAIGRANMLGPKRYNALRAYSTLRPYGGKGLLDLPSLKSPCWSGFRLLHNKVRSVKIYIN